MSSSTRSKRKAEDEKRKAEEKKETTTVEEIPSSQKKENTLEAAFKKPRTEKKKDFECRTEERLDRIEKAIDALKVRVSDSQVSIEKLVNLALTQEDGGYSSDEK